MKRAAVSSVPEEAAWSGLGFLADLSSKPVGRSRGTFFDQFARGCAFIRRLTHCWHSFELYKDIPLLLLLFIIFIIVVAFYLALPGLSCGVRDFSCGDVGSSSRTRNQSQAPCLGKVESLPNDRQGSPCF